MTQTWLVISAEERPPGVPAGIVLNPRPVFMHHTSSIHTVPRAMRCLERGNVDVVDPCRVLAVRAAAVVA